MVYHRLHQEGQPRSNSKHNQMKSFERGFQECGGLVFLIAIVQIYTWYTEGTKQILVIYRININAKCSLIILRQAKVNKRFGY